MTWLIKKLSEPKILLPIGIIYTLLITVAFLSPAAEIPEVNVPFMDKLAHVLIHWLLSSIWLRYSFSGDKCHISNKIVFVVLLICFSYGIIIEVLQHLLPLSRTFDLFDILANGIGGLIGLLTFWIARIKTIH